MLLLGGLAHSGLHEHEPHSQTTQGGLGMRLVLQDVQEPFSSSGGQVDTVTWQPTSTTTTNIQHLSLVPRPSFPDFVLQLWDFTLDMTTS